MAALVAALVSIDGIPAFPVTINGDLGLLVVDFSELFDHHRLTKYVIDHLKGHFEKAVRAQFPPAHFVYDLPSGRNPDDPQYTPRRLVMCLPAAEIFLEALRTTKSEHVPCRATLALVQAALFQRRYYLASLVQGHRWLSHARTF